MLTKFKQKFGKKLGKGIVFAAGLFLAILAFYGVSTQKALADATCTTNTGSSQLCDYSQIQLKVDELVNGQTTNFVRATTSGGFTMEVRVTLVSPPSLTIGATQINASGTPYTLIGAGAVMVPSTNNTYCGPLNISNTFSVMNCNNPPFSSNQTSSNVNQTNGITNTTVTAGSVISDYTFTVNSGNYSQLGLTQVNDGVSSTTGINLFYVDTGVGVASSPLLCWTHFTYNNCFYNTLTGSGNGFYVQLYNTQDQLNNANAAGLPPVCAGQSPVAGQPITCVPAYGGTTGAGSNPQNTVGGDPLTNLVNSVVGYIAAIINQLIYFIFYWLIAPLIQAILSIHVYTDTFVNVIYPGWEIVRNVCNILFIVAIIAMGMATLLRLESYQWRHLLVQLVIAALLVNFSLIIGQAILALADTIQSQFLPNNVDVIRSLAQNLMVANSSSQLSKLYLSGTIAPAIQYLFFVAMAIGSFIVFAAIAVFLVIRIVVLWVLLMLSPVAYVARILPATQQYAKIWWDNFIKYAFFTPIIAFFLNMTAVISAATLKQSVLQNLTNTSSFPGSNSPNLTAFVFTVASNILLLVFLILALKTADFLGVAGGKALSDIGEKGMKWPFQAAAKPFQAAGNSAKDKAQAAGMWADRNTRLKLADKIAPKEGDKGLTRFVKGVGFGALVPGAVGAKKKEAREKKYKEAKEMMGARAEDIATKGKANAAEKLELQRENEKVKKTMDVYENLSADEVIKKLIEAINKGDFVTFKALMKIATKEDYLEEIRLESKLGGTSKDMKEVYDKARVKMDKDKQKVNEVEKQIDANESDKGRYHNMAEPGRKKKVGKISIEELHKVDASMYMDTATGEAIIDARTGEATEVFKDVIKAMGNPKFTKDLIGKMNKSNKEALKKFFNSAGAKTRSGMDVREINAAENEFFQAVS